ncbi:hypothetical protein SVIOM74S_09563 [Streptomyces violarus]
MRGRVVPLDVRDDGPYLVPGQRVRRQRAQRLGGVTVATGRFDQVVTDFHPPRLVRDAVEAHGAERAAVLAPDQDVHAPLGPVDAVLVLLEHQPGAHPGALGRVASEPLEAAVADHAQIAGRRRSDAFKGEPLGRQHQVVGPAPLGDRFAAGQVTPAGGPQQGLPRGGAGLHVREDPGEDEVAQLGGRFVRHAQPLGHVVGVQQHLGHAHRGEPLTVRAAERIRMEGPHLARGGADRGGEQGAHRADHAQRTRVVRPLLQRDLERRVPLGLAPRQLPRVPDEVPGDMLRRLPAAPLQPPGAHRLPVPVGDRPQQAHALVDGLLHLFRARCPHAGQVTRGRPVEATAFPARR